MTFQVPADESNNFILKPFQAQLLNLGVEAVTLGPYPISLATNTGSGAAIVTTCTATATTTTTDVPGSTESTTSDYTVGQLAGAIAGVGTPLLIALILAVIVIVRQRRRLRSIASADTSANQAYQHSTGNITEHYYAQAQQGYPLHARFAEVYGVGKQEMAGQVEPGELEAKRRTADLSSGDSRALR